MKRFTLEEKNEVLETPFIHIHRKLDVLLNIAKLLMECGADTVRNGIGDPTGCYIYGDSTQLFKYPH